MNFSDQEKENITKGVVEVAAEALKPALDHNNGSSKLKDKISDLAVAVESKTGDFAQGWKQGLATKEDLKELEKKMATKEDLKELEKKMKMAMKEDLKELEQKMKMAMKEDLEKKMATNTKVEKQNWKIRSVNMEENHSVDISLGDAIGLATL